MTDTATAEFIKELGRISNAHATTQVFSDVVRAMRVALQRPVERDADYSADLERQYMALLTGGPATFATPSLTYWATPPLCATKTAFPCKCTSGPPTPAAGTYTACPCAG